MWQCRQYTAPQNNVCIAIKWQYTAPKGYAAGSVTVYSTTEQCGIAIKWQYTAQQVMRQCQWQYGAPQGNVEL